MTEKFDIHSFELLFKEHYPFLLLVSFQIVGDRDMAQDVVQLFFIDVWEKRDLSTVRNFQAYATRAVKNRSISHLRAMATELTRKDSYGAVVRSSEPDDFSKSQAREDHQKKEDLVSQLVDRLPEKRRQIFLDFVIHDLSYEEIAEKYQISINTVKTQMQRSYKFLKAQIPPGSANAVFLAILMSNYLLSI